MRSFSHGRVFALLCALGSAICAQQQFSAVPGTHVPLQRGCDVATVVADFDGDGLDDVFAAGTVRTLWLRRGPREFVDASHLLFPRGGAEDTAAVSLDYDRDGDPDLLLGSERRSLLMRNDGAGRLRDVTAGQPWGSVVSDCRDLAVGDVNGDGWTDVLFATDTEDRLYHGGAGGFSFCSACQPSPLDSTLLALFEDFDGDGDLDLFRSTGFPGQVRLELNDGSGNWSARWLASTNLEVVGAVVVDLEPDGDPDLVAWDWSAGTVAWVNDGTGRLSQLAAPISSSIRGVTSASVFDRDGDGRDDLLLTTDHGTALLRNAGGSFVPFGATLPDPDAPGISGALVDADSDGDRDIVLYTERLTLWLDDGDRFVDATRAELGAVHGGGCLVDVDADGDLDVIDGGRPGAGQLGVVFLNDGLGRFTRGTPLPTVRPYIGVSDLHVPPPEGIATADVDGDGDYDALLGQGVGPLWLLYNDGTGVFTLAPLHALPWPIPNAHAVAVAEIVGDAYLDVVVAGSGGVEIMVGIGQGRFGRVPPGYVPDLPRLGEDVELADVDRDGDLDILVGSSDSPHDMGLDVFLNDGVGRFTRGYSLRSPVFRQYDAGVTVTDFDDDGDVDVVHNRQLLANDGRGRFTEVTSRFVQRGYVGGGAVFVDVDGDGDEDLLTDPVGLRKTAAGTFVADATLFAGASPRVHAAADVDADGDVDLLGSDALYRNRHRELSVSSLPRLGGELRAEVFSMPGYGPSGEVAMVWLAADLLPAPVDLPSFGRLGVDPGRLLDVQPALLLQPTGVGAVRWSLPGSPVLVGPELHLQAAVIRGAYPAWRLTRVATVPVLR